MKFWLHRVLGVWLVSLGAALILFPYNDTRSGRIELEAVFLERQTFLDPDAIATRFPGQEITDITGPALNPDDYPDLWRVFSNLGPDWPQDTAGLEEWNRFRTKVLKAPPDRAVVVFREKLILCSAERQPVEGRDKPPVVKFTYVGRYNPGIKQFSESDLSDFPAVMAAIKALEGSGSPEASPVAISRSQWDRITDRHLNPLLDGQTFRFEEAYYGPEFGWDYETVAGRVPGLRVGMVVIGVLCLAGGALFMRRLYVKKAGIMVNPRKVAILYDAIALAVAIPSAYMALTMLLEKLLFIPWYVQDDFLVFMGTFFFVGGVPILTLYTSRFTLQGIHITPEGITVDGMAGKEFMPWESLERVELSDEYIPVGRVGLMMPKKLQKRLKLKDASGRSLMVNEPQLSSVKKQIIRGFDEHAPDALRQEILECLRAW
jgi:hypothetical protein